MKLDLLTAFAVLAIVGAVLVATDFVGRPDLLLDMGVFLIVAAVFGVRLWLGRRPRG